MKRRQFLEARRCTGSVRSTALSARPDAAVQQEMFKNPGSAERGASSISYPRLAEQAPPPGRPGASSFDWADRAPGQRFMPDLRRIPVSPTLI